MKITGTQWRQLSRALLDAYPTRQALTQMVRVKLSQNLEEITSTGTLADVVFELIRWAEAQGRLDDLICAGYAGNPNNALLRELAAEKNCPPPTISDTISQQETISESKQDVRNYRNRLLLLEKVENFWINSVLEKSVHTLALLEVGKQEQPEAVAHPWATLLQTPYQQRLLLPPYKKAINIFERMYCCLLFLGEPGSVKTTTLLEIARAGIERAKLDPTQPIPVVFNLSSWTGLRPHLVDWLVEELRLRYQIPPKVGRPWIKQDMLLLLLDGLDEVRPERREACAKAINQFRDECGLTGVVVCCRVADYERLNTRLNLGGAITLQPLTPEQIATYLDQVGERLTALRTALENDGVLQQLAASPMMLSIMSVAYQDVPLTELQSGQLNSLEARRDHVFAAYVNSMFNRVARTKNELYSKEQTVRWLSWLAANMARHNPSMFLIEQLQPSWLETRRRRWLYMIASWSIAGLLIGMVLWVVAGRQLEGILAAILSGLFGGIISGLLRGMAVVRRDTDGAQPDTIEEKAQRVSGIKQSLIIGGSVGLVTWIIQFLSETTSGDIVIPILKATIGAIIYGAVFSVIFRSGGQDLRLANDIQTTETLNWSWGSARQGVMNGAALAVAIAAVLGLILILNPGSRAEALLLVLGIPLVNALLGGLRGAEIPTKIVPNQGIRQSRKNALIVGLLFGSGGILISLVIWLVTIVSAKPTEEDLGAVWLIGLEIGVLFALLGAFRYGGLASLQHYTLRFLLAQQASITWNCARFLDYATERVFLQKVGAGYRFTHRLLLDYFADRNTL
jgi:eukaryotic-like serine/threonine-protein kinase